MRETTHYRILSGQFGTSSHYSCDLPSARLAVCQRVERTYMWYFLKTTETVTEGYTIMIPELHFYCNDFDVESFQLVWNRTNFFRTVDCAILALEEINKGLTCHLKQGVELCR